MSDKVVLTENSTFKVKFVISSFAEIDEIWWDKGIVEVKVQKSLVILLLVFYSI